MINYVIQQIKQLIYKIYFFFLNKSIFDENVIHIILKYFWCPTKILLEWIPISNINWKYLSLNKNAIHLLENNQDKIDWTSLSRNTSIFEDERMPNIKND